MIGQSFSGQAKCPGDVAICEVPGISEGFWQDVHQVFLIYNMCIWGVRKCGYPNNWLVYFMENPKIKWMINLVVPLF
jgi:hypothetical protein